MVRSFLRLVAIATLLAPLAAAAQENSIVRSFHPEMIEKKPPAEAPARASQEPTKAPAASDAAVGTPPETK